MLPTVRSLQVLYKQDRETKCVVVGTSHDNRWRGKLGGVRKGVRVRANPLQGGAEYIKSEGG